MQVLCVKFVKRAEKVNESVNLSILEITFDANFCGLTDGPDFRNKSLVIFVGFMIFECAFDSFYGSNPCLAVSLDSSMSPNSKITLKGKVFNKYVPILVQVLL